MAADRVTRVTLQANASNYIQGMQRAAAATREVGSSAERLAQQRESFDKVGKAALALGAVAAVGVGAAIKAFADFDAKMSQVQTLSHATGDDMKKLSDAALTMGTSIGFSAGQVADAETELVKAGVSVKDIMGGGLKGALDLAAAGQIGVADATSIAASALTEFGLRGADVPHVADLLAAGADKALGGVSELGQALSQSGLVAHQFGLTIDDTVGTLAEFAQNGLMGSDAGTSLKQMFLQLASPSKQAAEAMKSAGFEAYDAQGKFIGITKLSGELNSSFSKMSDASRNSALSIIFGSDAIRAATILMKDGAKGNQAWIKSVDDTGFAAIQAAGKMNNFNGDLKKLESGIQTGLIKSGSAANGALRGLTQEVTGLVNALTHAPGWLQGTALGLTALTAAVALGGGAFLTVVPKIAAARVAMSTLNVTAGSLAKGIGKGALITVALAAVANGVSNLGAVATLTTDQMAQLNSVAKNNNFKGLDKQFSNKAGYFSADAIGTTKGFADALNEVTSSANQGNIATGKFVDGLSFGLTHISGPAEKFTAQFAQLGAALGETAKSDLPAATEQFNKFVKQAGGGSAAVSKLLQVMPDYKAELIDLASAQGKTLSKQDLINLAQGKGALATEIANAATQKQNDALAKLTGNAATADKSITDLANTIKGFGSTQLDTNSAERDFQAAIDDAQSSLKEHGRSLDITTESGRANAASLDGIASSAIAATAAIVDNGGSQEQATAKIKAGRQAYIDASKALGVSQAQAEKNADALKLIPANVATAFSTPGLSKATSDTGDYHKKLALTPKQKTTQMKADKAKAEQDLAHLKKQLTDIPSRKNTVLAAQIAAASAAISSLKAQLDTVPRIVSITAAVHANTTGLPTNASLQAQVDAAKKHKAVGGAIYGPGSGTSDSIPAMLSNGEYVVKADSVRKYGVARLDAINSGALPKFADGGYVRNLSTAQKQYDAEVKYQDAAEAALKAAKTTRRKTDAKADLAEAKADVAAAKKRLESAKAAPQGASLSDKLSFRSSTRDGTFDADKGISSLYSMAQDSTAYSGKQRGAFLALASKDEVALNKLEKQSDKAADAVDKASDKLSDLKSSAASMASSVASNLSGSGISSGQTATGFRKSQAVQKTQLTQLAALLKKLRGKGLDPALLAQIAGLDPAVALQTAKSFDALSSSAVKSVNADFKSVNSTAASIGKQVADANYGPQIKAAQTALDGAKTNAKSITDSIARESEKLRKVIGKALGLPGYATGGHVTGPGSGTSDSINARLSNGEFVMNAAATRRNRWQLEAMNKGGYAAGGYVQPTYVRSSGSGGSIDYGQLAAALKAQPREVVSAQIIQQPIRDQNPHTAAVLAARELEREMRKHK